MEPANNNIMKHRKRIDEIDRKIIALLEERVKEAKKIGEIKKSKGKPIHDPEREKEVINNALASTNLNARFVEEIFRLIIEYCRNEED